MATGNRPLSRRLQEILFSFDADDGEAMRYLIDVPDIVAAMMPRVPLWIARHPSAAPAVSDIYIRYLAGEASIADVEFAVRIGESETYSEIMQWLQASLDRHSQRS